jgi:hypothetical protein
MKLNGKNMLYEDEILTPSVSEDEEAESPTEGESTEETETTEEGEDSLE